MPAARRGFSLLELLIMVAVTGVMTLASVPFLAGNLQDARAAEARATMCAIRDRARTVYGRGGKVPNTLSEMSMSQSEVASANFNSSNYSFNSSAKNWKITCTGVFSGQPSSLVMYVDLVTGEYSFNR